MYKFCDKPLRCFLSLFKEQFLSRLKNLTVIYKTAVENIWDWSYRKQCNVYSLIYGKLSKQQMPVQSLKLANLYILYNSNYKNIHFTYDVSITHCSKNVEYGTKCSCNTENSGASKNWSSILLSATFIFILWNKYSNNSM